MKITVAGSGYVGLATAVTLAYLGNDLTCLDVDEAKIESLRDGRIPFHEPHTDALLALVRDRIRFTTSVEEAVFDAEIIFLAVGTPSSPNGQADLRYVRTAAESIGQHVGDKFTVVVNKSTVPVGSANWVEMLVRESYSKRHGTRSDGNLAVASNPEFLREGQAMSDALYPDRVVLGADDPRAIVTLKQLYAPVERQTFDPPPFLPRPARVRGVPVITTSLASAELIKYAANAFLATKVSFANEIGRLAEAVGGDVRDVAAGIGADQRIGNQFLNAGIGWGGSCFGKDTAALVSTAEEYGLEMPIVSAARKVNAEQRNSVVTRLISELKILKGRTIGLLGLAFKPDTDDLRDSPGVEIARKLFERGARVRAHDPIALDRARRECEGLGIVFATSVEDAADHADALVLATEWNEYRHLNWTRLASRMRGRIVIDGRNFLDRAELEQAGMRHLGFGVSNSADITDGRSGVHRNPPLRETAEARP